MTAVLERRARDLDRLTDQRWDLLVVGGGIVGVGAALDAALRGLRVALIERDDIASGTSSRSSKLIHGGLRYLEHLHFGLVRQALDERSRLLRLAPHLVRLEAFLVPIYGNPLQVPYIGAGMVLYGLLGAARDGGWPRVMGARRALEHAPSLRPDGLRGAFVYTDGVEDDARLALTVARTAQSAGALVLTRVEALAPEAFESRPVAACDRLSGTALEIRTDAVLDATGASRPDPGVLPSRGAHILVPRERISSRHGLTIRVPGRVIFVIPWKRHWIIGTTDVPHDGDTARPAATATEVDYLIEHANAALSADLTRADVVATYAGVRPLAVNAGERPFESSHASREHRVLRSGRVTQVRGGKYTTYRLIARDAVNAAVGRRADVTRDHRLLGAADGDERRRVADDVARRGVDPELAIGLAERHGTLAGEVAAYAAAWGLLSPLGESHYLEGEVAWAVEKEMAFSLDDVLARRTRLALEGADHGASVAGRVAEIMGGLLGWSTQAQRDGVKEFRISSTAEYGVPA
ncbi:MAG TPA: glycerol-3-phosphate dehydrogenase/oxidase [candidate division Zixibacteria bacterium]|nr:glycerol-3-phosphate dehydrogenase/oxidase [candidate division Zixibacteria bacterium]